MTYSSRSIIRGLLLALVAMGGGATLTAQSPTDLLNKAKADQSVVTQKVEAKIREAIGEARRLQATSPVRAANVLKSAMAQLEDPLIPAAFRAEWTAQLNTQIRLIDLGKKLPDPAEVNPARREIKEADLKRAKAVEEEYKEVRRTVDTIAALNKSGNSAQAQKEIDSLTKRYPDNPAVLALADKTTMTQRVSDARFLVLQQEQGYLLTMRSVDKAATPIKGDVEFDAKYWKEITEKRKDVTLTKKERQLMESLDSPINLGFKDAPFEEVIKAISNATGQPILLDKNSLMAAMVETNTLTSVNLRGVTARTALRKVLQDHNLTYVIRNESIQVVTVEQARSMLVTRVYYIGDLISGTGTFGGVQWGPYMNMVQIQENVARIMELIRQVDAESWREKGGQGSMNFNWPSMAIIVRQTAEFHARFGGSLPR